MPGGHARTGPGRRSIRPLLAAPMARSPLLALLALTACSSTSPHDLPPGDLYLTGVVATLQHSATASGVLVEPLPGGPACGIRATADAETRVLARDGSGGLSRLGTGAAGLAVGDRVEVYVDGPVAESCPVQGHASAFVRLTGR